MKTSNKLLLGMLAVILIAITALFITAGNNISEEIARGKGDVVVQTRAVESFNKIRSDRNCYVFLTQGPVAKVEVKTYENVQPEVEIKVVDGVLMIHSRKRISMSDWNRIRVEVTMPELQAVSLTDGGYVQSEQPFKGDALELNCASGSRLNMLIDYSSLQCAASMGALVTLEGEAETAEIVCTEGASVRARDLDLKKCVVEASDGSDLSLNVSEELSGSVSRGSDVVYSGSPNINKLSVSTGGSAGKK
jgi:hypothetical protein